MMDTIALQIKGLTTGYRLPGRKFKTLHKNLDLNLKQGELVCVLGPNGAGKSTLLKTALGFLKPASGDIRYNRRLIDQFSVKELARLVAVVLTDKIDDIYLTAREIIASGRYPYGSFTAKLTQDDLIQIEQAEKQVGIENIVHNKFAHLSDGEKQKVMITKSIVQATPLIFLDEPVAFVDIPSKIHIMHLLRKTVDDLGKGVLMATHDLDAALNHADRIWLLGNDGDWYDGKPFQLVEKRLINKIFDREHVTFDVFKKQFRWSEQK